MKLEPDKSYVIRVDANTLLPTLELIEAVLPHVRWSSHVTSIEFAVSWHQIQRQLELHRWIYLYLNERRLQCAANPDLEPLWIKIRSEELLKTRLFQIDTNKKFKLR
jgi:hypothetical protein